MKSVGYVRCAVCDLLCRGYASRGWKQGEPLHVWAHGPAGIYAPARLKCDGAYRAGVDTHLDEPAEEVR
jgi:hypothetical protein